MDGKLNEDHFSIVDILSKANRIVIEPKPLYYYVHHKNSITTKEFSFKSLDDLNAAQKNYNIIVDNFPEAIGVAEFRIDFSILKIIDKIMLSDNWKSNEYLNQLVYEARKNRNRILRSRYLSIKRKLSFLLLLANRTLYQRVVKENARRNWSG